MKINFQQPKPDIKEYSELIREIQQGIIKVPKFQREFVWSIDKTAQLLDSILKGYPIGTFILWQTSERLNHVKNVGNLDIPDTPEGTKVQYVLDGQQRITSLFAAYLGAKINKIGERKITDYRNIFVNIKKGIEDDGEQIITAEPTGDRYISLFDVLNFSWPKAMELSETFDKEELGLISSYYDAFKAYKFSIVILRKEDIDSAIEVFTRINTGGQTLTLFEIMSAKTYDEKQNFDMQKKWSSFTKSLESRQYDGISSSIILNLLSLILSKTKECKRKIILSLDKQPIIDQWDKAISAIKYSIDYFRATYRIPVSQLLPYDSLLVPFAYFFFYTKDQFNSYQQKYLIEFFWRASLSFRYSGATESRLAQDIKRIDLILDNQRPTYDDITVHLESPQTIIATNFSTSNSYCKAILCLLAYQEPKNFQDNGTVILDNSWLKIATSKNYHHFFPKKYLEKNSVANSNSIVNITFVSDRLNKRLIGAKSPSIYIGAFKSENSSINISLKSHLIDIDGFGVESDDYDTFLQARANLIFRELKSRIELTHKYHLNDDVDTLVSAGESAKVEFKSTLRYDQHTKSINKKLEYVIAKTIVAFLNSEGGDLFIGIDDTHKPCGLSNDIDTLGKKNIDGYELHLIEVIRKYIGASYSTHIQITFPFYENIQICRVCVSKSSTPVFITYEGKENFFVRSGCSSQPLSREEQSTYEKEHWGAKP